METQRSSLLAVTVLIGLAAASPPVSHDFNADGINDFPVSITGFDAATPRSGAARLWSGASKAIIETIVPTDTNTLFGWSLGSAGDLNVDGSDDIVVGEPLFGPNGSLAGRVRVYSGANGAELLSLVGPYPETGLGRYVAGIGDWNGDGIPDIAASGWYIDDVDEDGVGDHPVGVVFIFSGADGSILADIFDPDATALFGYSVFGLGDITGDGLADIAVVDRGAEGIGGATGRIHIFAGTSLPVALTIDDAHRTIVNDDTGIRGFGAQIDVMHPDVWLSEPTLQIISLVYGSSGGVNQAASLIDIYRTDGQITGTKGIRPTLVLAGDVNLDGKVDALDLAESISQLGTNPQALGVMPIADLNDDEVIDILDVALLLESYGEETDIYQGLWDGSRLLAVVAGASGFGSVGVGPSGGAWGEAPGPRPIGDCNYATWPPDLGLSLLPALLRTDRAVNCATCPTCEEPPQECYECDKAGKIVGGTITVNPEQPKPGDTVCFTWEPFSVEGRIRKCKPGCGPEGTECPIELSPGESWVIEKKNATTGAWEVIKSSEDPGNPQPCTMQEACAEIRFRLTSSPIASVDQCEALAAVEKVKEVQFAEFTLDWECFATIPTNRRRSTIGIGEEVKIWIVEPEAGPAEWEVTPNVEMTVTQDGRYISIRRPGEGKVTVTINGCKRTIPFTAIAPSKVNYTKCPRLVFHTQGQIDLRYANWMDLDPDSVSFYAVEFREVSGPATNITGVFLTPPASTLYHNAGPSLVPDEDNVVRGGNVDLVGLGPVPPGAGGFDWVIPLQARVVGTSDDWIDIGTVLQTFRLDLLCLTVAKDNGSHTACRDDPTTSPNWDDPQCPPE